MTDGGPPSGEAGAALGPRAAAIRDRFAVGLEPLLPLLPLLLALAVLRFGPALWPPLDALCPALAAAGAAGALLLAGRRAAGTRWPAALTLAATLLLLAAAALAVWPWARQAAVFWQYGVRARAQGHDGAGALAYVGQVIAVYQPALGEAWATWIGTAAGLLLPVIALRHRLVVRPVRTLLGLTRAAADGPWRSAFLPRAQRDRLARNRHGLPLGLADGRLLRYTADPDRGWLAGHHAVFAGTRAGKGVSCVLPAILDHDGPVVVLDIKGENFAVTRRWRATLGRRVAVLNPFGVIEPPRDRYNPLDYLRPDHLARDAALVADGLIRPEPGADSHFTDIARSLLTAALEVTAATAPPDRRTLPAVAELLLGPAALETLQRWAAQPGLCGGRPAQAAAVLRAGDREQGSFFTTLARNLDWLASEAMRDFLSASDVALEDLLDDRLDLYLVVPLDLVAQQANFLRLLTNLVLGTVIRQDGRRTLARRLLLVLDEFTRLGPMTQLLNIATVAAGAGIEALFVAQDKGSVDSVWGPAGTGTLLGACATVRVFGLGRTDHITAQWAAAQLGHRTLYTESYRTGVRDRLGDRAGSRTEVRDPLLTADQLQELPPDRMLCFLRAHPALLLDRLVSHRHPAYRDKLDPNPTRRA